MPTDEELRDLSDDLYYEIWMLTTVRELILSQQFVGTMLHAIDFVPDWPNIRSTLPPLSQEVRKRAGIQIAHLGYKRTRVTESEKPWPVELIARELFVVINRFLQEVPPELLGDRWKDIRVGIHRE